MCSFSKYQILQCRGGFRGKGVDWVTSHPLWRSKNLTKMKKIVNIMVERKANTLDRYLIVITSNFF